jgi:hypothetical protein
MLSIDGLPARRGHGRQRHWQQQAMRAADRTCKRSAGSPKLTKTMAEDACGDEGLGLPHRVLPPAEKKWARARRATEMPSVLRSSPVHGASNIFLAALAATVIEQAVRQSGNAY